MRAVGRPRSPAQLGQHVALVLAERREERAPFGIDGVGVAEIALVELFDERRVGAEQERCLLRSHGLAPWSGLLDMATMAAVAADQPFMALSISSPSAAAASPAVRPPARPA